MRRVCAEFNARLRVVYTVNLFAKCITILTNHSTAAGASFYKISNFLCYSACSVIAIWVMGTNI